MYHIEKICPGVETFEVTPKLSPENIPSESSGNQEEDQVPKEIMLGHVSFENTTVGEMMDTTHKQNCS